MVIPSVTAIVYVVVCVGKSTGLIRDDVNVDGDEAVLEPGVVGQVGLSPQVGGCQVVVLGPCRVGVARPAGVAGRHIAIGAGAEREVDVSCGRCVVGRAARVRDPGVLAVEGGGGVVAREEPARVGVLVRERQAGVGERNARVAMLLDLVGLSDRTAHRPHELSGGEQQRVGIARALANNPPLLLADEPTGQLDSHTGRSIMNLIKALVASEGVTAIVATHDPALIDLADRVVDLLDRHTVADTAAPPP